MLSEEELRVLYEQEHLTDKEIAFRLGTTLRQVNYFRRKYRIATVSKSTRATLYPLTQLQRELLLGSLLGDGRLFSTGLGAVYEEYHSLAQEGYLMWKAAIWADRVCSVRTKKKIGSAGRVFEGKVLRTVSSTDLVSYWKDVYPSGSGNKTYTQLDLTDFSSLSLAVWYLDDGHITNGYPRLSVTPEEQSQSVLLELLRGMGLSPSLYTLPRRDAVISLHGRANTTRFYEMVAPHVPECMQYKLKFRFTAR